MSEEKSVMNNPFLVWGVFVLIPVASFGLYVYEVFFKEEKQARGANTLYKEARLLEAKGNRLKAYINYSTIVEIHKDSETKKQAAQRLNEMKKSLEVEILSLAGNNRWTELRKKRDEITKLLPARIPWLDDQLKNKGKSRQDKNDPLTVEVNDLKQKIDLLIASENFTEAFQACKKASLKNKNRKFKKQAKYINANIHYEYAMIKKNALLAKIDGADIGEFKNDFPEEVLEIRAHLKKYLKMSSNSDAKRIKVKEFFKKLD
ncbi:hypothetical protein [Candidatus Uabimicrobium sp. HlEnr_7]|uniref:hypothetical protein n=1 Tax=Candidatus Uabimicrobium helgolandensis TaxID=3095367 RepID=UPI0035572FB4